MDDMIDLDNIHNCESPRLWLGAFPQDGGGCPSDHLYFDVFTSFRDTASNAFLLDLRRMSCSRNTSVNDIKLYDKQRVIHHGQGQVICIVAGSDVSISRCVIQQQQQSDMDADVCSCTELVLQHTSSAFIETARDALCCLLSRWESDMNDSDCEFVKHLKLIVRRGNILDAVRHVAHVDTCLQPAGYDQKQLKNALELLYTRSDQLKYLWHHLLNPSADRSYAFIGASLDSDSLRESVYKEIEIAHQGLAACHRIISSCSAIRALQGIKTTEHPFLDGPHPHPISSSFYTGGGVFHQLAVEINGHPPVDDIDAAVFFVNNPAASERLNVIAWSSQQNLMASRAPQLDVLHNGLRCCNFAASIYGSIGGNVPSVSHRRSHDAVARDTELPLTIGSTCAALCLQFECRLARGSPGVVMRGGRLTEGMLVSGMYIEFGTTLKNLKTSNGSTTFELSIPHTMNERDHIDTRLFFTHDDERVQDQKKECFDTLLSEVRFLKEIFTTNNAMLLQSWSEQPYHADPASSSQNSSQFLLHVARTALVTCTSALVELAPAGTDFEIAKNLEEEIMQGLYDLLRSHFDDEIFGVMLDISCNAYHRVSNGGAVQKLVNKEGIIVRALSLFNYVDVHSDGLTEFRRNSFARCLSSESDRYSQLLQRSAANATLIHESRILQAYVNHCLRSKSSLQNPFGTPLPEEALPQALCGPPCIPHSYEAHSCFIILCDLAQYLHSPNVRKSGKNKVRPQVPRLIIDVFMCRLHMSDNLLDVNSVAAASSSLLLHAPLSHELCYLGWRLCCWLTCGRLPRPDHAIALPQLDLEDSMIGGVAEVASGNSKHGNMSIMEDQPIGDMNGMYWNAGDSKSREVSI